MLIHPRYTFITTKLIKRQTQKSEQLCSAERDGGVQPAFVSNILVVLSDQNLKTTIYFHLTQAQGSGQFRTVLKIDAESSSETLVPIYRLTHCNIPED